MTLSSLKEKVNAARCPLPLFTCLHVKPDVSELMFAGMFHLSQHPLKWRFQMLFFTDKVIINFIANYNTFSVTSDSLKILR